MLTDAQDYVKIDPVFVYLIIENEINLYIILNIC